MTVLITHVADPVWLNNSCARRSDLLLIFDYKTSNFACLSFFTLRSTSLQRIALMRVHVSPHACSPLRVDFQCRVIFTCVCPKNLPSQYIKGRS